MTTSADNELDQSGWLQEYLAHPGIDDPYPRLARLREEQPACPIAQGAWVFTRYEDIDAILRDRRWSRFEAAKTEFGDVGADSSPDLGRAKNASLMMLINRDEPDHSRIRNLLRKAFTPRAIESWAPRVQQIVDTTFNKAVHSREIDFLTEVAYPVPEIVICELMGVPHEDHALWGEWSAANVARRRSGSETSQDHAEADTATVKFYNYFKDLVGERRRNPSDDLVSVLCAAEEAGDRLTEDELIGTLIMLVTAGHETTANTSANGLYTLLCHPDQLEILRRDPALVPQAVEEMLRYEPTVRTGLPRMSLCPITIGDVTIPAGSRAILMRNAANRDPGINDDPDRFDVQRTNIRHMAFGAGIHFCLGAALARLELTKIIEKVVREFPEIRLVEEPTWRDTQVRSLNSLRVILGPSALSGSTST